MSIVLPDETMDRRARPGGAHPANASANTEFVEFAGGPLDLAPAADRRMDIGGAGAHGGRGGIVGPIASQSVKKLVDSRIGDNPSTR
jgi:hypothetical protein